MNLNTIYRIPVSCVATLHCSTGSSRWSKGTSGTT